MADCMAAVIKIKVGKLKRFFILLHYLVNGVTAVMYYCGNVFPGIVSAAGTNYVTISDHMYWVYINWQVILQT